MPSPRLAPGTIVADDYKVIRPLSERDVSCVYLAEQLSTGAQRALKVLDPRMALAPGARARFEKEARVGAQIESEHVALVVGAGIDSTTLAPWLAMEFLDADDLASRVAARHGLAPGEAKPIFDAVCDALSAAHNVGVVHGGLAPRNVIVGRTTKVLDFGVAKLAHDAGLADEPPVWKAPELVSGGALTPAADVWSLGLLVFFALTERAYFRAANAAKVDSDQLVHEMTEEPLEKASERAKALGAPVTLSAAFDAWFARCVAREASDRFADAGEAHAALGKALAAAADVTTAPAVPAARPRPKFAQKGTMVMDNGPADARPPSPVPPAPEPPPPAPEAAAAAPAKKKKPKPQKEMTMTVGLGVAPGFSADEIIARDLGRPVNAKPKTAATMEPENEPPPEFRGRPPSEPPLPPEIPLPRARAASDVGAEAAAPKKSGGRGLVWGVVGVVVVGAIAFGAVRLLARPVGGGNGGGAVPTATTSPEDSAKRAADEAEAERKRQEEAARATNDAKHDAASAQAMAEVVQASPQASFDAATFTMGSNGGAPNEQPPHEAQVGAFLIDVHEVTAESYDACVKIGACTPPSAGDACNAGVVERKSHPANCVDHSQAAAYCAWLGERLPTEAEWEYAAAGPKKAGVGMRRYPWGESAPDKQLCWDRCGSGGGTCAVGSFAAGNTPQGLSDMAGNVAEWTDTPFCSYASPGCSGDDGFVVRGGAWCGSDATTLRAAARQAQPSAAQSARIGFRCAKNK